MIGYLYQITNKANGKKYIGKTNDIQRRLERHFSDLKNNRHHSHKLQRAYNKYGKDNFIVTYETFLNISEEELNLKEIKMIQDNNSYTNGYNETLGGEGHVTAIDFNNSVLIYHIGQLYDGVKHKLSQYFNCDRTTITAIMNRDILSQVAYNKDHLEHLISELNLTDDYLKENYKDNYSRQLSREQVLGILAAIELEGYGQAVCAAACEVHKDIVYGIVSGKTYKEDKKIYNSLSLDEKNVYLNLLKEKTKLEECKKTIKAVSQIKITQEIVDYIMDNKEKMTQKAISEKLNIDRKRVGRIINKQTYKEMVEDWERRNPQ